MLAWYLLLERIAFFAEAFVQSEAGPSDTDEAATGEMKIVDLWGQGVGDLLIFSRQGAIRLPEGGRRGRDEESLTGGETSKMVLGMTDWGRP